MIKKYMRGQFQEVGAYPQWLYRATILAVDPDGGVLENPSGSGDYEAVVDSRIVRLKASVGLSNPPFSLKCRLITDGWDKLQSDADVGIFWPLTSEHAQAPVKPGEHVYVAFEDQHRVHGLWLGRVSGHDGLNVVVGATKLVSSTPPDTNAAFDGTSDDQISDSKATARPNSSDDLNSLFVDEAS